MIPEIAGTMPEQKLQSTRRKSPAVAPMMPTTVERQAAIQKATKKDKKTASPLLQLWPVAVAVFLSGFAQDFYSLASDVGIWALRLLFPFVLLSTHREIGIDSQMAAVLPGIMIYLQLPLDGLLMALTLATSKSLRSAIGMLICVHGVSAFVLWLLTQFQ